MGLELIVGLGIAAALFLYFALNLKQSEDGDDNHFLLRLLLIFFFLFTLFLIPKATMDTQTSCQYVLKNTTTSAPDTIYNYDYKCNMTTFGTEFSFYRIILWFTRLFFLYFIIYLFWDWAKRSDRVQELFRKWGAR